MSRETSHGLTSLHGLPHSWMRGITSVKARPKLMVIGMNERCINTSPQNTPAPTYRHFGFVTALTTALIGTIASLMVSFLTSIGTSLLSWKSNLVTPFAPGSKFGLYMSLWFEQYLGRIGNMLHVKSPPIMIQQSSFPSRYAILHGSPRSSQDISASISYERGN